MDEFIQDVLDFISDNLTEAVCVTLIAPVIFIILLPLAVVAWFIRRIFWVFNRV